MNGTRNLSAAAIWRWPLLLGVLTGIGLVSALFSDGGFGDMLAGVCLAAPVAVGVWFGWLRRTANRCAIVRAGEHQPKNQ